MSNIVQPDPSQPGLLSQQVTAARYFFLRPPAGSQCNLAFGGRERCAPDYMIDRRGFPFNLIEFIAEGHGQAESDGAVHDLKPGMVIFYGRRARYVVRNDPKAPMVKYFACFRDVKSLRFWRRTGLSSSGALQVPAFSELHGLFEDLLREGQHNGPLAAEVASARFQLIVLKVAEAAGRSSSETSVSEAAFIRCRNLIDAEACSLKTLSEIARRLNMAPGSLCRLFRKHLAMSPYQYLLHQKMMVAAQLILESGSLVKEAGQAVGFSDPYHFSRCFRSVMGIPPVSLLTVRRRSDRGKLRHI